MNDLDSLVHAAQADFAAAVQSAALEDAKARYLGKSGRMTELLKGLGALELALGIWVLSGFLPSLCAVAQVVILVALNINGLLWARRMIHDPAGMVVKNACFLLLAWVMGASA